MADTHEKLTGVDGCATARGMPLPEGSCFKTRRVKVPAGPLGIFSGSQIEPEKCSSSGGLLVEAALSGAGRGKILPGLQTEPIGYRKRRAKSHSIFRAPKRGSNDVGSSLDKCTRERDARALTHRTPAVMFATQSPQQSFDKVCVFRRCCQSHGCRPPV